MLEELLVTKRTIQFLTTSYRPIRSLDFFGYIVPYDAKKKYFVAIWMNGKIMLFPAEPHYKLSERRAKKLIKKLVAAGVLEYNVVVFEDFDERKHIPYDKDNIVRVPEYFFFPPTAGT